jgi:hypothetical protein
LREALAVAWPLDAFGRALEDALPEAGTSKRQTTATSVGTAKEIPFGTRRRRVNVCSSMRSCPDRPAAAALGLDTIFISAEFEGG